MIDALIKWAIIAALCAAAITAVYKAWDHYIGEPYREDGREEVRADLGPQLEHWKAEAEKAIRGNEVLTQSLNELRDRFNRLFADGEARKKQAAEALARSQKERAEALAKLAQQQQILSRTPSKESCEGICARARAELLGLADSVRQ